MKGKHFVIQRLLKGFFSVSEKGKYEEFEGN